MKFFGREFGGRESGPEDSFSSSKEKLVEYYSSLREGAEQQIKRVENLGVSLEIWKKFFEKKNMEEEAGRVEETEQMLKDYQEVWEQQREILASIEDTVNISDDLDKAKKFAEEEHKKLKKIEQVEKESNEKLVNKIGEIQKIGNGIKNFEEEFKITKEEVLAEREEKAK